MSEPNACCQEWRDECNKHLSRIAELDQQVAALKQDLRDSMEDVEIEKRKLAALKVELVEANRDRDMAYQGSEPQTRDRLVTSQVREGLFRKALENAEREVHNLRADRGWTNRSEFCPSALLTNPPQDSALQQRLSEEREKCAEVAQKFDCALADEIAEAIRSMP